MHNTDKIPTGWAKAKISDLFDFIGGGTPSKKELRFWNGEIPWASVKDIKGNYLTSTQDTITEIGLANSAANIANPGEVILITRISPGKVITTKIKTAINQDLKIVRPKYDANPDFIRYLFNTLEKECVKLSSGTTVLGITLDVLNNINIIIPPLNEQNRIVDRLDELLSELEKGKEQLQTSLEQLKVYRQSILKHAFEGMLSEVWRKKQKKLKTPDELVAEIKEYRKQQYEKQLKEYKAGKIKIKPKDPKEISLPTKSELADKPELPDGWTYLALTEIVENESTKISPSKDSKLKFVGMDCIEPHSLRPFKYHDFADFKSAGNFFEKDRVLYGRMRPYLNKIWRTEFAGACSGEFLVLHPTPVLHPDFLKYKLHSSEFVTFAMSNISGDRPRIAYDEVVSYIFPVCSIEEQVEIIHEVERLFSLNDEMEKTLQENLVKSDALKQGLLQKAFEGKIVEQDPTEEPASALLERIQKEREDFLKVEKERKKTEKPLYMKYKKMAEELKQIIEILKESKEPVSSKKLWDESIYKNDIDEFYAALKKHIEAGEIIELPRKGKESFLKLADAK